MQRFGFQKQPEPVECEPLKRERDDSAVIEGKNGQEQDRGVEKKQIGRHVSRQKSETAPHHERSLR